MHTRLSLHGDGTSPLPTTGLALFLRRLRGHIREIDSFWLIRPLRRAGPDLSCAAPWRFKCCVSGRGLRYKIAPQNLQVRFMRKRETRRSMGTSRAARIELLFVVFAHGDRRLGGGEPCDRDAER